MKNIVKFALILFVVFIAASYSHAAAQADSLKNKIDSIKKAEKVVIWSDGKEVEFTNGEAEKLLKKLKNSDKFLEKFMDDEKLKWIFKTDDGDHDIKIDISGLGEDIKFLEVFDDVMVIDIDDSSEYKKITVNGEGDDMVVEVTTKDEDGNEVVKEYKGEEAEEYLKKLEEENGLKLTDEKTFLYNFEFDVKGKGEMTVNVDVNKDDDEVTVTIDETKNGETTTKVLTGKDAEEWLKEHESTNFISISKSDSAFSKSANVFILDGDEEIKAKVFIENDCKDLKKKVIKVKTKKEFKKK